jgi:hypothetical protein
MAQVHQMLGQVRSIRGLHLASVGSCAPISKAQWCSPLVFWRQPERFLRKAMLKVLDVILGVVLFSGRGMWQYTCDAATFDTTTNITFGIYPMLISYTFFVAFFAPPPNSLEAVQQVSKKPLTQVHMSEVPTTTAKPLIYYRARGRHS